MSSSVGDVPRIYHIRLQTIEPIQLSFIVNAVLKTWNGSYLCTYLLVVIVHIFISFIVSSTVIYHQQVKVITKSELIINC